MFFNITNQYHPKWIFQTFPIMTLTWVQDKLLRLTRKCPSQDESKLKTSLQVWLHGVNPRHVMKLINKMHIHIRWKVCENQEEEISRLPRWIPILRIEILWKSQMFQNVIWEIETFIKWCDLWTIGNLSMQTTIWWDGFFISKTNLMAKHYGLLYNPNGNEKFHTYTLKAQFRRPNDFSNNFFDTTLESFFYVFTS